MNNFSRCGFRLLLVSNSYCSFMLHGCTTHCRVIWCCWLSGVLFMKLIVHLDSFITILFHISNEMSLSSCFLKVRMNLSMLCSRFISFHHVLLQLVTIGTGHSVYKHTWPLSWLISSCIIISLWGQKLLSVILNLNNVTSTFLQFSTCINLNRGNQFDQ